MVLIDSFQNFVDNILLFCYLFILLSSDQLMQKCGFLHLFCSEFYLILFRISSSAKKLISTVEMSHVQIVPYFIGVTCILNGFGYVR